jgi:hydroxymethylglutaryl-CoA synthase
MGAYAPLLRLERASAARALRFFGLVGRGAGFRAVAGWDEDALTMALEAARIFDRKPDVVNFASTSAPFLDRSHSTLLIDALALSRKRADMMRQTHAAARSPRCWTLGSDPGKP